MTSIPGRDWRLPEYPFPHQPQDRRRKPTRVTPDVLAAVLLAHRAERVKRESRTTSP